MINYDDNLTLYKEICLYYNYSKTSNSLTPQLLPKPIYPHGRHNRNTNSTSNRCIRDDRRCGWILLRSKHGKWRKDL